MTKKEAIYILRNAAWLGSNEERQKVEEAVEVVAKAIEALNNSEIPNSSDCIDRAEAQTAIQFAARRYTVAHEAHGEGHVVWSDNLISVTDAMNALREVPSAQPEREKGEWIQKRLDYNNDVWIRWECSRCGYLRKKGWKYILEAKKPEALFCEMCGADMRTKETDCDYERAVEQLEHDMLYEPTFNQDDGSM